MVYGADRVAGGRATPAPLVLEGTVATRDWLIGEEPEEAGLAVYGYVLLLDPPAAGEARERAARLCDAFTAQLAPAGTSTAAGRRFVTYWPVRSGPVKGCKVAIEGHDPARLSWLRTCLRLESRRGPVLVAQAGPYRAGDRPERLVLDLSDVETGEIDHTIDHWKRFTIETPTAAVYNVLNALATFVVHGSLGAAKLRRFPGGCDS